MYIVLEGIDTAGKSTQLDILKKKYPKALFVKEPGGTRIGTQLRSLVLNGATTSKIAEMFLFLADRAELIQECVEPNLKDMIISDRSLISGIAYASFMPIQELIKLNLIATNNILPTHTILLKLSKEELEYRLSLKHKDSIESRGVDYLLDIQNRLEQSITLLQLNALFVDASLGIEEISERIEGFINA